MALDETVNLPSGAVLTLKDAPFQSSMQLLKAVLRELSTVATGLKLDVNLQQDPMALSKLMNQDISLDLLKNALCQIIASETVEHALMECFGRCLYNGRKGDKTEFENRDARQDYLPALWEVMKYTLSPFFAGLKSKSPTAPAAPGSGPK